MKNIFVACPSYDGRTQQGNAFSLIQASRSKDIQCSFRSTDCSSITRVFNTLWAMALNERKAGITHFAMLHDDIIPEDLWLDKMVELMDKHGADVLSAVSPQKNTKGLTSIAFDTRKHDGTREDHYRTIPLTMAQVYGMPPDQATWTHERLLVNTGLMLVDMRKPWVEDMVFRFENDILKGPDGEFRVYEISEDWYFSREAAARGAKLFATREVGLQHIGRFPFPNNRAWGSVKQFGEQPKKGE